MEDRRESGFMELTGVESPAASSTTTMTCDAKQKRKVDEADDALVAFVSQEAKRFAASLPTESSELQLQQQPQSSCSVISVCLRSDDTNSISRGVSPLVVNDWLQTFKAMSGEMQLGALDELLSICEPGLVRHLEAMIVPRFQKDFISILPSEVTLRIFGLLSPMDLCHSAQVSKAWLRASEDNLLWARKCELLPTTRDIRDFPPALARRANWEAVALSLQQELLRRPSLVLINLHNHHLLPFAQRIRGNRNPGGWQSTSSAAASLNQPPLQRDASGSQQSANRSDSDQATPALQISTAQSPTMERCLTRARQKAEYLRCSKIVNNWRRRRPTAECQLRGHDEHVITCLQVHGELIVTGSDDNSVRVWSAATAQCLHLLLGHTGGVWTLLLSKDGKWIISGSTDRTVCVWNAESGDRIHTLIGHVSTVRCMALKDDVLVSGSRDCTLRVWNSREGRCVRTLCGHGAAVRCVQFDGRRIVSGSYDCGIIVWDAKSGEQLHTLEGHTNKVYSLLLEGERDLVISGSLDTTIRVWNIATGECLHTLTGHDSLTSGMQLKGNMLVSANADSTIKVWNIVEGRCIHTLAGPSRHTSAVTSLQLLDSGMVVSSGDDGTVKLWDLRDGSFVRDLVRLESSGAGGCIWRLKATKTMLVCAAGSRNGTEDTKLILMDFDAPYP